MSVERGLAGAALVLGLLAAALGARAEPGGLGVAELSTVLAEGEAYVDPVTLGAWIRDRRPDLRIMDVRDSADFRTYAIPTAENVALARLPDTLSPDDQAVIYDDGSGIAVRGWLLLRRLGYPRAMVLEDGLLGWMNGVMSPVLPAETPEERRRFDQVAEVSRYFGGVPTVGELSAQMENDPQRTREAIRTINRRGCF